MEEIVNGHYLCLRKIYSKAVAASERFYLAQGQYCGPGTAPVATDSKAEEALGMRCAEGLCCAATVPLPKEVSGLSDLFKGEISV